MVSEENAVDGHPGVELVEGRGRGRYGGHEHEQHSPKKQRMREIFKFRRKKTLITYELNADATINMSFDALGYTPKKGYTPFTFYLLP